MGECRYCGMTWEASFTETNGSFVEDPSVDTCVWCQVLRIAWRKKDKAEILYWSNRMMRVARAQSNREVIDIGS